MLKYKIQPTAFSTRKCNYRHTFIIELTIICFLLIIDADLQVTVSPVNEDEDQENDNVCRISVFEIYLNIYNYILCIT